MKKLLVAIFVIFLSTSSFAQTSPPVMHKHQTMHHKHHKHHKHMKEGSKADMKEDKKEDKMQDKKAMNHTKVDKKMDTRTKKSGM